MEISNETINERLGFDFWEYVREFHSKINTEYDGPNPTHLLTSEEQDFIFEEYLKSKGLSEK